MKILFIIALAISVAESCKCDSKFIRTTGTTVAGSIVYDTTDTSGAALCAWNVQARGTTAAPETTIENFNGVTTVDKKAAPETTDENLNDVTTAGIEIPTRATTAADEDGPIDVTVWRQTLSPTIILDVEGLLGSSVGIIIGVVIAVLLIAIVTGILLHRRRAARKETERKSKEDATFINSSAHPNTSASNAQQDVMYHTISGKPDEGDSGYENVPSGHPRRNASTRNPNDTGESGYASCGPKYMNLFNPSRTLCENQGHQEEPAYLVPLPIQRPQYMDLT